MKKLGLVTKILLHVTLIVFGIMAVGGSIKQQPDEGFHG